MFPKTTNTYLTLAGPCIIIQFK